ncbi:MAG: sel1 repeat family protein [Planctomycetes bacterium]|nr:sel1 repeat family protein [Planctomycetota bacterium]
MLLLTNDRSLSTSLRVTFAALFLLVSAITPAADHADLIAKAEKGDAPAQFELARKYVAGDGVAKDDAAALRWFRKAAAQDHTGAEVSLGAIYANGTGVPQDRAEAVRWYRKASLKGDMTAQYNLGLFADTKDEVSAVTWFRLAAEQGHMPAQFALGELHENGKGIPRSDFTNIWSRWGRFRSLPSSPPNRESACPNRASLTSQFNCP